MYKKQSLCHGQVLLIKYNTYYLIILRLLLQQRLVTVKYFINDNVFVMNVIE